MELGLSTQFGVRDGLIKAGKISLMKIIPIDMAFEVVDKHYMWVRCHSCVNLNKKFKVAQKHLLCKPAF